MDTPATLPVAVDGGDTPAPSPELLAPDLVVEELLVEEISIDGMCGVY